MTMAIGALNIGAVEIDENVTGSRWEVLNKDLLTQLVAIVALGQATRASLIIASLELASPEFSDDDLIDEACVMLTVQEGSSKPRTGYPRSQRDGFIFEVISWVAAQQEYGIDALLKDPHVRSTTQGLDGLMIKLSPEADDLAGVTIFEDKCTEDPRAVFRSKVLPAFKERHANKRSAELVAAASLLIQTAGLSKAVASKLSQGVMRKDIRSYRSAFAVTADMDTEEKRRDIFGRYAEIDGINKEQRIGASFVAEGDIRSWFESMASDSIEYLRSLKDGG